VEPKVIDKRWMRRLILLDLALVALLGWLGFTVWQEAQAARAAKRSGLTPNLPAEVGSVPETPLPTGENTGVGSVDGESPVPPAATAAPQTGGSN
jgi:hypothetical protein